jgi:hypothetical protein
VVDYRKVAEEERAKHDAAGFAATEDLRQREASSVFFRELEVALAEEIRKANPELEKHGLLTGHKSSGIALPPKRFPTQIRLTYGRTASCEVNFDQSQRTIYLELTVEPETGGETEPQRLAFQVSGGPSGPVARKVESGQDTPGEFGTTEVAEIVILGLIRGHLE